MHNGLIVDVPETTLETTQAKIQETLDVINGVKDKNTKPYIEVLISLKNDYEILSDFDNAMKIANECLELLYKHTDDGMFTDMLLNKYILSCYDTKARCGDFESFLLAIEWKRPIEKQFYIPRRTILKKFGLIQAFQDVADGKVDFLCVNLPPRSRQEHDWYFLHCFHGCFISR